MSKLAAVIVSELDDETLDVLAERLAPRLRRQLTREAPTWLNAKQAAEYIAAPVSRMHDLVALGRLNPRRDGRRLVFKAAELDAYLESPEGP